MHKITRTLAYDDPRQERQIIGQDEVAAIREPIVVLGDPGLGKSVLTQMLGKESGMKYYRAGTFVRAAKPDSLISKGECIIIDGLDEIASTAVGGGVEAVLKQLSAMGNPTFILSCREADWRGAVDRAKIEDDYASAPILLHLQPFQHDDARAFLSNEFPSIDANFVLDHLASRGLEDIYKNPLTLRLLGEVAQEAGALPNSRAELLDRACRVMLKEKNPHHLDAANAQQSDEDLLLAAGALCATQLLCDRIGVFTGAYSMTVEGFAHVADIVKLPFGKAAIDALKTRLFQAEGEGRFTHIHRVVAEYLGAKWLAHCFDAGISERRIFGLFLQGEGVPTSLRGLHAWTGHFSDALSGRCIAADPYAVLRYGDADTLGLEQARVLLTALAKLSDDDPYFRSEDWGQHPASGLMRVELKNEILAIISAPRRHTQLTVLLINAMVGTELAKEIAATLDAMMFDQDRYFDERANATDAMRAANIIADWEPVVQRLLAKGDADSARLAFNVLEDIGSHTVSTQTSVETVLAHIGLTVSPISNSRASRISQAHLRESLFGELDTAQLGKLLDSIAAYARPLMRDADHSVKAPVADLVRHLTVQVLEADSTIAPEQIWAWVGWLDGSEGYSDPMKKRLTELFSKEQGFRSGLLEHVLLTPREANTWMAGYRLHDAHLGLFPTNEDLVGVLKALRARSGDGAVSADMWLDVVRLGQSREGIADIVCAAATETANCDPELLAALAEMAEVVVPQWEIENAEREARAETNRQMIYQSHRDTHTKRADDIAAGNFYILAEAAECYLGQYSEFDRSEAPEARLREFLGDTLAEQALAGFIAVLGRSDLPTATEIAKSHSEGKVFVAERPMICGVAEMVRSGSPIDMIDRATLAAVLMAWHRALLFNSESQINIGPALETALFTSEIETEEHFRASIEPQLACRKAHPEELYRLTHEAPWAAMAGRLTAEWLRTFPALPAHTQSELMSCALESSSPDTLRTLIADSRATVHPNYESMLLWLLADYVVDFDNSRSYLEQAAADDPDFFWLIRDRVGPKRGDIVPRFSVAQLVYIVEAFGSHWPKVERPTGTTSGDTNRWDATEFIERVIYAIANTPSPEATEALQSLINGPAPSYGDTVRHALALQRKGRRDNEYIAPTVEQFQAVMTKTLPETVDDMRAYFADRIETVQERMQGSNTDMWEAYWQDTQPKGENYCRNRLIEHISGQLPPSIRFEPEMHMPRQKRADIAAIRNSVGLPIEIKGQWHRSVWSAPIDQLDAKYTRDWHAKGRGAYIVLWFGNVPKKQLTKHPEDQDQPTTPQALRQMLVDRMPEARRSLIDVFVIDVTRPA